MKDSNTLTVNDIATVRNIIDLACRRGAFGASEIKEVGLIYEKLDQFVATALAQAQAEADATAPTTQGE